MLPGLQFTDFHKFLVSAGGLACAAGLALPIFLLRTQKTISVTNQQLGELSGPARQATVVQQSQLFWLLRIWPWASAALVVGGLVLVIIGAVMWKSRQEILNSKEAAEIRKIDAEREKAFHEGVALAKKNSETPQQTVVALEDKISESTGVSHTVELTDSTGASDSVGIHIERSSDDSLETGALKRLLADLPSLPMPMQAGVQTLTALELVAGALERSDPEGGELVRNVRLEDAGRADFLLLRKDESKPDLAIDVRFVQHARFVDRAAIDARDWATRVALSTLGGKKRLRPVAFLVTAVAPTQNKLTVLDQRFMDPSEPGAALLLFTFESLANLKHLDLDGSLFTTESSATYALF